jgi:hypothetical protein
VNNIMRHADCTQAEIDFSREREWLSLRIRDNGKGYATMPALVLTVYEDDERIFEAVCAGACGYLLNLAAPSVNQRHPQGARKLLVRFGVPKASVRSDALQLAAALDLRHYGTHYRACHG